MKSKNISEALLKGLEEKIASKKCKKTLIFAAINLVISAAIFVAFSALNIDAKHPLYFIFVIAGGAFFIAFLLKIFSKNRTIIYLPTQSLLQEHVFYIENSRAAQAISALKNGEIDEFLALKSDQQTALKMHLLLADDGSLGRFQLFSYVSYVYEPYCEIQELTAPAIAALSAKL